MKMADFLPGDATEGRKEGGKEGEERRKGATKNATSLSAVAPARGKFPPPATLGINRPSCGINSMFTARLRPPPASRTLPPPRRGGIGSGGGVSGPLSGAPKLFLSTDRDRPRTKPLSSVSFHFFVPERRGGNFNAELYHNRVGVEFTFFESSHN